MVWNISKDDDNLLGSSKANLSNHREPITELYWLPESNSYDNISVRTVVLITNNSYAKSKTIIFLFTIFHN